MRRVVMFFAVMAIALAFVGAAWAQDGMTSREDATRTRFGFPLMQKGSQKLIVHFDSASGEKCQAIVRELEKLGWKMEKPKDGAYGCKPDLILEMSEYSSQLTDQIGRVEKILLKLTATPKEIARKINGIQAKHGVVLDREPSASVELGRNLIK
jgi:hypothetical protein